MTPAVSSIVDWDAIDTVLVDMDGTLLDLNFDTFFWRDVVPQRYASLHNLSVPAAQATLAPRFEAKVGTLEWYCLDHWASDLGLDLKTLKREHRGHIRFLPGAKEFLARVRARGKRLSIVTNAHRDTFALKAERTGIDRLVDSSCARTTSRRRRRCGILAGARSTPPFDQCARCSSKTAASRSCTRLRVRHTLAIRRPDSQLPPRATPNFLGVDGVFELV
jgi:putative hydrolase of the HAD superfamily